MNPGSWLSLAVAGAVLQDTQKPRWRWDWKCGWWYRSTDMTFEVWDPYWATPMFPFREAR